MPWPLSQDYNEALQNPATCFADADLKAGTVTVNSIGVPAPRSGNFADVYQLRDPDGRTWALKCFTRKVAGLQERYRRIDEHLRKAALPFTVGFRFYQEGIRVRGSWYPLLQMEWVEGFTLNDFVRANLAKIPNLESLFQIWLRLSRRLRDSDIAHADLQHGNVLLVPGTRAATLGLKLIDYDGMWVPSLADKPSGELGHPAYQNPQRAREKIYSKQVDRFPHLVIGTALLSLIVGGPEFWKRFDNGDNMLFREADLKAPESSPLVKALWNLGNPTLCHLLGQLALACWRPLNQSAWLDELMSSPQALALSPKQEREVTSRLGVTGVGRAAAATNAMAPEETPNVFADLTAELPPPRRGRAREEGSTLIYWLIGGVMAFFGLVVLVGSLAVVMLAGRSGRQARTVVENTVTTESPTTQTSPTSTAITPIPKTTPTKSVPTPPVVKTPVKPPETPQGDRPALLWSVAGKACAGCLEFTPEGEFLLAAPGDSSKWSRYVIGPNKPEIKESQPASVPRIVQLHACSDGNVLTVSEDNSVFRWHIDRGDVITKTIEPERGDRARPFALSPTELIGVTIDPEIFALQFFNLRTGKRATTIEDRNRERAISICFAPDGKRVAAVSRDFVVSLVTLANKAIDDLTDPSRSVRRVVFSPDGKRLAGFGGAELVMWELGSGAWQRYQPGEPITDAAFAGDGERIFFVTGDRMLRIWDTKLKRELEPIALPQSASCVRVSPDGHYAATASADGDDAAIQLWQLAKTVAPPRLLTKWPYKDDEAGLVETAEALDAPIRKLAIGDEGARLFVATSDGKLRLIDTKELKQVGEFEFARSDVPASFALLSESSVIAGQRGQAPREWDATKGQMQRDFSMPSNQKPGGARWQLSADGKLLMTFAEDSQVNLWDVPKGEWLRSLSPHSPERAVEAALSPDGRLLLAADDLGLLRLIDTVSGQPIRDFSDKAGETVSRLVFSLDGKKAAGGGAKGKIWIWDVATGKIVQTSSKFDGIVKDLAFTADGKRLIAVSEAPDVLVWDVVAGEERRSFPLRQGAVCVTLTPDGKYAVTASPDNAVQIWRLP